MKPVNVMSVSECIEYFRSKLSKVPYNIPFYDDELMELFRHHYRFAEKTRGRGVRAFLLKPSSKRSGSFELYAVLDDGSEVDWSYIKACRSIGGNLNSLKLQEVLSAFRNAVEDQVREFVRRNTFGGMVLTYDGKLLPRHEVDVHHEPPFKELVSRFIRVKGLSLSQVPIKDIGIGYDIADQRLRDEWREFHIRNARLVIVERKVHREDLHKHK